MSPSPNNTVFYLKRILGLLLLLTLATTFFYSAYSKMFTGFHWDKPFFSAKDNFFVDAFTLDTDAFDSFRWNFLDMGINSITLAGAVARMMIGFEFMIGLFLLCHIFLKKLTYPIVISVLSVFIVYLVYTLFRHGNTGNCGCFGNKIEMTPVQAILKNLVMIIATLLLYMYYPVKPYKGQEWLSIFIGMAALVTPFIINPINEDIIQPTVVNETVNLDPLYQSSPIPGVELRKGKHIVAFMSLTCRHCQKAAYLLQMIHHQNPNISIFLVLAGHPDQQKDFFKETHAEAVPHMLYTNSPEFVKFTTYPHKGEGGHGVPAIYWINNSTIEYKSTYYQLDPTEMKEWIKK